MGIISLEQLPIGKYKLLEIETLEDYILEKTPIYFELDGQETEKIITITNRKIEHIPNTSEEISMSYEIYLEERKKENEKT